LPYLAPKDQKPASTFQKKPAGPAPPKGGAPPPPSRPDDDIEDDDVVDDVEVSDNDDLDKSLSLSDDDTPSYSFFLLLWLQFKLSFNSFCSPLSFNYSFICQNS
jgi:hypothetical protein